MKKLLLLLLLTTVFLTGCGGGYSITYNTVPEGASLICSGVHKGYTPKTLNYDVDKDTSYLSTKPCYAKWSSGVQEGYSNFWDIDEFPDGVMRTLQRPSGGDYSQDARFALDVQNMRNQRNATRAVQDAASAASSAASALQQLNTPTFYLPPPVPITFGPPSPFRSY